MAKLFVEGKDDEHTLFHLLKANGYDWDHGDRGPEIEQCIGVEQVMKPETLEAALLSRYVRIGLVVDADFPPRNRWLEVRDLLRRFDLSLPDRPPAEGTVVETKDGKRVGVWLMPDNSSPGTLEHLVETLIPTNDPTQIHATSATLEAQRLGAPLRVADAIKGSVYAWLAWREDPGQPFGSAINKRYLSQNSRQAQAFIMWFRRLFESAQSGDAGPAVCS